MTQERWQMLAEVLTASGLDALFFMGLPWVKKKLGRPVTKEDRAVLAQARDHVDKGEHNEARKLLVRHIMGWGLYDEEIFDEDMEAVTRSGLATTVQMRALEAWLNSDVRKRSRFRNSLTLQESADARMNVIADYAKMATNAERDSRLTATGKLDDSFEEVVWNLVKTHVPGMSRAVWNAITTGASAVGRGALSAGGAIRTTAVVVNRQANIFGLELQRLYPAGALRNRTWFSRFAAWFIS